MFTIFRKDVVTTRLKNIFYIKSFIQDIFLNYIFDIFH